MFRNRPFDFAQGRRATSIENDALRVTVLHDGGHGEVSTARFAVAAHDGQIAMHTVLHAAQLRVDRRIVLTDRCAVLRPAERIPESLIDEREQGLVP